MSPAAPPRKRSKTFTGCWTCRARKIKCDEAKPECHQCSDKGVHCEGYSARLQWLTPATHERRPDTEDPLRAPINQSLRRLLPTGMLRPRLVTPVFLFLSFLILPFFFFGLKSERN